VFKTRPAPCHVFRRETLLPVGHRAEELAVALGLAHLREQEFHPFDGGQRREDLAEHPHPIEVFLRDEQLLFTGAALLDVDRRKHAAIRDGVNTYAGYVTHAGVAESQGRQWRGLTAVK